MNNKKSIFLSLSFKIFVILIIAFVIGGLIIKEYSDILVYGKGLLFGGLFVVLKLKLLEITITKAVKKQSEKNAKAYASLHYGLRYLLTGIVLALAALEPSISLTGVIIALLSVKLAVYWEGYKDKATPKDGSVDFVEWEEDEEESSDF